VLCKTKDVKAGPNVVPVPDFQPGKMTSSEFQEFASNIVNGAAEEGAAED